MSSIKNIADINKSQENLLFKMFEPRAPSLLFPELTYDGDGGSDGFTDGSQESPQLNFRPCSTQSLSSSASVFNFDLSGYNKEPVVKPTNLMGVNSGDPNLPKRLHVSNIPFRYR